MHTWKSLICFIVLAYSHIQVANAQEAQQWIDSINILVKTDIDQAKAVSEASLLSEAFVEGSPSNQSALHIAYLKVLDGDKDFDRVISSGKKFIKKYQNILADSVDVSGIYNYIGNAYYSKSQLDTATFYYIKSADAMVGGVLNPRYPISLNNIAGVYKRLKDYTKANQYMKRAVDAVLKSKDSTYLAALSANLASGYKMVEEIDSARMYAQQAIEVGNIKGQKRYEILGMSILASITKLYEKDNQKAIILFKQVYSMGDKYNYETLKYKAAQDMSDILSDPKEQLKYAREAYEYYSDNYKVIEVDAGMILVQLLKKNGKKEEAYDLLYKINQTQDSLYKEEYTASKLEMLTKYETAEKEVALANKEKQLTQSQLANNRLIAGIIIAGLLGLLLLAYLIYQQQRTRLRQEKSERRLAQLETMILKSQMNPHFMFNSLNSIRYLFMKDQKDKGLKYITKFAKLLRTTLNHGEHALVPLSEEMELTELYIDLEQLRFDDKFEYSSSYSADNFGNITIPPFVIQPIVENAFWHGLSNSQKEKKLLNISINSKNNTYHVVIEDNGVGLEKSKPSIDPKLNKSKSYGLSLIKERFDLINKTTQQNYTIEVLPTDTYESGVKVIISISKKE